jgi:hypothetical protein
VRWLVETDPRFADYRTWLSSDFMLAQLGRDPAATLKRLGDGFYEQRLIADQIIYATGYRFVGDYRDDEAQYQALMQAGVEFGNKFQLTVGVALSQEQMKQLTGDLVWLVEQDVRLADGSVQRVLVPQVYVVVKEGDLRGDGTLISARSIDLNLTGDLDNNALIATRDLMQITAQNINNVSGGRLSGGTVELTARNDLNNLSGIIASRSIHLVRQKLPRQHHIHPIPLRIRLAHDVHREVDRAHDAVAEFLVDQFLDRQAVHIHDLVPAVDQRIGRHCGRQRTLVRHDLQPGRFLVCEVEQALRDFGLRLGEGHLAEAGGGRPFLALAEVFGDVLPLQALLHFGADDLSGHFVAIHGSPR